MRQLYQQQSSLNRTNRQQIVRPNGQIVRPNGQIVKSGKHLEISEMTRKIRYEILVPLRFNDGSQVPSYLHDRTVDELTSIFGGCSMHACSEGVWKDAGVIYRDTNRTIVVDVYESICTATLRAIQDTRKERYQQHSIYIVHYPIEIL